MNVRSGLIADAAPADSTVLELDNVCKEYENGRPLLTNVTITVKPSQSLAVVGPSGSGKSTLLYIMGGLVRPTRGRILICGAPCHTQSRWDYVRAHILGFVFQELWLLPALTASENLEMPMIGVEPSSRRRRERVDQLLESLALSSRANTRASNLSGGERQRVALARAIANRPRLVLADEPSGSLDGANTELVVRLLHELCDRERVALVIATHDMDVARTCGSLLSLKKTTIDGTEKA